MSDEDNRAAGPKTARFLGSLRDALAAASRDDTSLRPKTVPGAKLPEPGDGSPDQAQSERVSDGHEQEAGVDQGEHGVTVRQPSAAEAAREARGGTPNIPPVLASGSGDDRHVEFEAPPTTRVVRKEEASSEMDEASRTQMLRGKQQLDRESFNEDPVVGWVVVIGGPGLGSYRPIFEGNNSLGRSSSQRVPIDFGDNAISSEEQAFIRYDSTERGFLFVPNLSKANVVSLNDKRPTGAVPLNAMDVITVGRTQLVFVPFCGADFDWADLNEAKGS